MTQTGKDKPDGTADAGQFDRMLEEMLRRNEASAKRLADTPLDMPEACLERLLAELHRMIAGEEPYGDPKSAFKQLCLRAFEIRREFGLPTPFDERAIEAGLTDTDTVMEAADTGTATNTATLAEILRWNADAGRQLFLNVPKSLPAACMQRIAEECALLAHQEGPYHKDAQPMRIFAERAAAIRQEFGLMGT